MKLNSLYTIKDLLIISKVKIAMRCLISFFNLSKSFQIFHNFSIKNSTLKTKNSFLFFFTFNFLLLTCFSQTYPVQINTQLVPPYSGYLPDYGDPTAQNLKVFLQFNDFTTPQYNLRLKFEIKGNGFSLVTKATYNPPPITLQPGQPILLSGTDIAPYLSSSNLDFIGINQNQYEQRMALPEGYYSICITAYDYYSGTPVQVSNEACGQGWFTLSNPPLLNLPLCNTVVTPLQPQNLFFSWTPVNLGSPNSAFNTSYLFELWEMRPDSTVNPNQLVQNTQPVFSQVTTFNSLNYGITETPLLLYTKYAWRVRVMDGSGKDWFINNGYSQVCTFYYGSIANTLGDAVNLNLQAEATDYVSGVATWTLQNFYNSYQLDVRELNTQDWTSYTTTINTQALTNLQPGKTYECRVKGFGNAVTGDFSNLSNFTTPLPPTINLQAEALDYTNGRAFWALQNSYNTYQLEVRKKNTPNWFPYTLTGNSQNIDNLEPNKTYECRVKGFGTNFNGDYGNIAEFNTPPPPSYNCNQAAPIYSNNATPLPFNKAVTGMTVKSGQFDVKIKFINPGTMGAGYYTGNGYAMMFGILPIPVTFTNVFIDANQRQQQGVIHAVTKGMKKWLQQFDIEDAEENATYVEGTLDSVYINGNQYCYIVENNPNPVCLPIDTTKLPLVIRDGEGNQYVVNAGPPPTVTGPTSYLNVSTDNLAANDNLKVQFAAAPNQNFGFDSKQYPAFTEDYECIKLSNGKNYFVANKSVGNGLGQSDRVIATYTINNFNASQLSFKTMGGATLTKTGINNNTQFEITNIPPNADCIYAWYNNQKIGKLNIISLDKTSKKVVLVPVNGASAAGITQQGLNDIYKQANANFTLTTAPNFTFDLGNDGLEAADAKLMSKYSTEMRALREAYKKKDSLYDKNAYYIFIVPSFSDVNLKGYMVRGRALGFVSSAATTTDVAHELAHGAFKLEHTFDAIAKGTSNNLLDYSNNTHLTKSQWLNIQNPSSELTWWDEEEDGSSETNCTNTIDFNLVATLFAGTDKGDDIEEYAATLKQTCFNTLSNLNDTQRLLLINLLLKATTHIDLYIGSVFPNTPQRRIFAADVELCLQRLFQSVSNYNSFWASASSNPFFISHNYKIFDNVQRLYFPAIIKTISKAISQNKVLPTSEVTSTYLNSNKFARYKGTNALDISSLPSYGISFNSNTNKYTLKTYEHVPRNYMAGYDLIEVSKELNADEYVLFYSKTELPYLLNQNQTQKVSLNRVPAIYLYFLEKHRLQAGDDPLFDVAIGLFTSYLGAAAVSAEANMIWKFVSFSNFVSSTTLISLKTSDIRNRLQTNYGKDGTDVYDELIAGCENIQIVSAAADFSKVLANITKLGTAYEKIKNSFKNNNNFTNAEKQIIDDLAGSGVAINNAGNLLSKVVLGSEELSQFAVNFRKTLPVPNHKGNVAVFEYIDNSGNLVKKAFTTQINVASHSEELAIDFFTSQNIPKVNIMRIYSELEPCELAGHTCKAKLTENFPSAQKIFSYDYPGGTDNTIRVASVNQRYIDLEQLLK